MKRNFKSPKQILLTCTILLSGLAGAQDLNPCKTGGKTCYFGVEMNDVLCGYAVETYCDGMLNGKEVRFIYSDVILKMSALGTDMDGGFRWKHVIDPVTNKAMEIQVDVINGESVVTTQTRITGDTAWFSSHTSGVKKAIHIDPDVIFTSLSWYPHLYNDFIKMKGTEKRYNVYDPLKGEVTQMGYVLKSEETIELSDSSFQTMVLEETEYTTGIKTILWLNKADGFNVKAVVAGRRNIYFADRSVTSRITFANIDNELFAKVDRKIPDIMNLSWLRVKAKLNSYGEEITEQDLNYPGQKFDGKVSGSLIDGIFEIKPVRYTGKNAPPFPPDFSKSPELIKYLEPELVIESDDPLIISEAARITAGSKDSWEAAVRLGKWVAENIAGVLPGGISAINTLKTREAECGGHSRLLTAFCRAVRIPARVVVGCMYTSYHSGGFGQHAWTEVYMGDTGWIPLDATINEPDYIDAGHIKLGEKATFRPVTMEVLDFRSLSDESETNISDDIRALTGSYMNVELYRMFKIIERNGGIAIDIPGRAVLDLNLPDNEGKWFPKMTREISLKPENIEKGKADKIILHQYFRLRKMSSPDSVINKIPEEFRKYAGNYQFAPARLSLDVMFDNGALTTQEPLGRSKGRVSYLKTGDSWIDKTGSYQIAFIAGNDNEITSLNLTVGLEFLRGEPVTNAMEPVINQSGVEAGLKKYDEIKSSGNSNYFFSEQMLHQLGHNLLKKERFDDAIMVFLKNVKEYPDSFIANDALAETYMKNGDNKQAVKYFKAAVKLNPDYEYGYKMIEELKQKK
ncbi:MAG: tetratricopeptide repeat protein [Bacteroidales bacterium]|nr:tetratricopeptide repeat protein [Bacteroidales bacterium]